MKKTVYIEMDYYEFEELVEKHFGVKNYEFVADIECGNDSSHTFNIKDEAFAERGLCGFLEAWIGRCKNSKPCSRHMNEKCWKCGKPAIKNCAEASSLVCGIPECSDHPHIHNPR